MSTPSCPGEFVRFANGVADAVGQLHRRHFRRDVPVEFKEDGTPVTPVDHAAEALVRERVAHAYPEHGVIGEELAPERPDAEHVWVTDPLDGTWLFVNGKPLFGFLLALAWAGRFILGVIDHPALRERWVGADGHGTVFNGRAARTRCCPHLDGAMLCRPGPGDNTLSLDTAMDRVAHAAGHVHWGVTPYDYGLVASGYQDLIVAAGPKLHDLAPLDPVLRNAGGAVRDWDGKVLTLKSRDHVVAAGDPRLLEAALSRLQRPPGAPGE